MCADGLVMADVRGPAEALRVLLLQLVEHAAVSQGMAVALEAIMATDSPVFGDGRTSMETTLGSLLRAGAADTDGSLQPDIGGGAVLRALGGICGPKTDPDWYTDGRRVAALLFDGLTHRA